MECSHVSENVLLKLHPESAEGIGSTDPNFRVWKCSECDADQSIWLCLFCGYVSCGRYISGHAKAHYEKYDPHHSVCIELDTGAVFCYNCDDFVTNDAKSGVIGDIRKCLFNGCNDTDESSKENRATSKRKRGKANDRLSTSKVKRTKVKFPGLKNLGNTCFMNAVLQSLSNIGQFREYIKQMSSLENKVIKKKTALRKNPGIGLDKVLVSEELRKIILALCMDSSSAVVPSDLFHAIWQVVPRFRGYQQQDAHEFMRYLLERLHVELVLLCPHPPGNEDVPLLKKNHSIVSTVFGGLLQNEVRCLTCGVFSKRHDPFLDLSLDIPAVSERNGKSSLSQHFGYCLSDCLAHFVEIEELSGGEMYMCSHCKSKQKSTKKFWIKRLPQVLCLHLKRFRWNQTSRVKVDSHIEFPLEDLDMSKYLLDTHGTRNSGISSSKYNLVAVIVHHGNGASTGHYTAYALHQGHWYNYNDQTVTTASTDDVRASNAYILFYTQASGSSPQPGRR